MGKRVSHSLLDPWFMPPIKAFYHIVSIPQWYPPEGIIAVGHLFALLGGIGMAFSTTRIWGGLLLAVGVAGNHIADCLDGTHARSTGQCRNGGELLDHFVDPLSFTYWLAGLAVATDRLGWGMVAITCLYATAVLTNIKAKICGEFTLQQFGPTEFKTLLILFGMGLATLLGCGWGHERVTRGATLFFAVLIVTGIVQLTLGLYRAVREVNAAGPPADVTEWEEGRSRSAH